MVGDFGGGLVPSLESSPGEQVEGGGDRVVVAEVGQRGPRMDLAVRAIVGGVQSAHGIEGGALAVGVDLMAAEEAAHGADDLLVRVFAYRFEPGRVELGASRAW
ncbi:hypothetical protein ACFFRA_24780 [Haloechinothrix salitolerans]